MSQLYENSLASVVRITTEDQIGENEYGYVTTEEGIGSGVYIDTAGFILTAAHVIQTANNILVEFSDGEKIPAKAIGLRGGEFTVEIQEEELVLGGDIILVVNDILVIDEDSLVEITKSMQEKNEVQLKILREGKILVLSGTLRP